MTGFTTQTERVHCAVQTLSVYATEDNFCLYYVSGGWSQASDGGEPGSIPVQSLLDSM